MLNGQTPNAPTSIGFGRRSLRMPRCAVHYATHGERMNEDLFESLRLELRRGCLVLAPMPHP